MRSGILEMLIVVALFACGVLLAFEAWSASSSYADGKDTYTATFSYTPADGTADIGTYQNACRSGVAYIEDGGTGAVRLHSTPSTSTPLSGATAIGDITGPGLANAVVFNDNPARFLRVETTTAGTGTVRVSCANFVVASAERGFSVTFEGSQAANCGGITDVILGTPGTPQTGTDCNFVGPGVVQGDEALRSTGAHYIDFLAANTSMSEQWTTFAVYLNSQPSGFRGMLRPLTGIGSFSNPRVQTDAAGNLSLNCTSLPDPPLGVALQLDTQYWVKQYWNRDNDDYEIQVWEEGSGRILDYKGSCDGTGGGIRIGSDANAVDEVFDVYEIWDGDPGDVSRLYPARNNQAVAAGLGTSDTSGVLDGSASTCWGTCVYAWTESTSFGCVIDDASAIQTTFSGCTSGAIVDFRLDVSSEWPTSTDTAQIDLDDVSTGFPYTIPFMMQ